MPKKLSNIDERMPSINGQSDDNLPTIRDILRLLGNVKSDTADNARRTVRILRKIKDKTAVELILETDDMNFLSKKFEENSMNLLSWAQGWILDVFDNADKVEPKS